MLLLFLASPVAAEAAEAEVASPDGAESVEDALKDEVAAGAAAPKRELPTLDGSLGAFDTAVKSGGTWFIMFHAPWCGHCRHFMPTWQELAAEASEDVHYALVDGTANQALALRLWVQRFPTLILIHEGYVYRYKKMKRTKDMVAEFAAGGFKTEAWEFLLHFASHGPRPIAVIVLTCVIDRISTTSEKKKLGKTIGKALQDELNGTVLHEEKGTVLLGLVRKKYGRKNTFM